MGLSRGGARLLIEEARQRPFEGRILQLGRQHVFFGQSEMDKLASLHSVELRRDIPRENVFEPLTDSLHLDDGTFFSQLGFSKVESIDYSSDESPTFVHDLNTPVPDALKSRYDVVYDGGTMEHIFDVRSVLHNIFDMVRIGGRVIHASPSSNHVDHGFYMFSPTLFLDYYATNSFIIHELQLFLYTQASNIEPWCIYDYEPGCLASLSNGGFDQGKLVGIHMTAEKTPESTWDKIPQQGMYARTWKNSEHDTSKFVIARKSSKPPWPVPASPPPPRRGLLDRAFNRPVPATPRADPVPNKVAEY